MIGQALADGVLTGAVIALGAIGVSFTLQIMRFANFSHAELLTWGLPHAGVCGLCGPRRTYRWPVIWRAADGRAPACGATHRSDGVGVDRMLFRRLRRRGAQHMTLVFASFGAALVLRHVIVLIWGHDSRFYTRELQMSIEVLPGVRILPDQVFILGVALLVLVVLHLFLRLTRTGIAMRAAAENPALAQCCGIEVEKVIRSTWMIGGALAAAAGSSPGSPRS